MRTMAEFQVHVSQARHNESTARHLLNTEFFDWSITACFYAAIHVFEARLFIDSIDEDKRHSETSVPRNEAGEWKYTQHRWREIVFFDRYPSEAYKRFRSLKESSETARYLSHYVQTAPKFETVPAFTLFATKDAKFSIDTDLETIKEELRVGFVEFLYNLGMQDTDPIRSRILIHKILDDFGSKDGLLGQTADSLAKYLTRDEVGFLETHLKKKGFSLKKD